MCSIALGLLTGTFANSPLRAATHHSHKKSEVAYAHAEDLRRALEAKPVATRKRFDYVRVIVAYRAVYHGDPASPDAGHSIAAVAELLASAGRCFHDRKLSQDAVGQWEFLRHEYPENPLRQQALFQQAQIQQHDLHDPQAAQKTYRNFLGLYPQHSLAKLAEANLDGARSHPRVDSRFEAELDGESTGTPAVVARHVEQPRSGHANPSSKNRTKVQETAANSSAHSAAVKKLDDVVQVPPIEKNPHDKMESVATPARAAATIQSVRYWAKGKSTRIAVDMDEIVPYHAYLTDNGTQITLIFFGAHPAKAIAGRATAVEHDSNLRSIRTSILTTGQSTMVLKLSRAANFSSFTLSNPDRLILDIRPVREAESSAGNDQARSSRKISPLKQRDLEASSREPAALKRTHLENSQATTVFAPQQVPGGDVAIARAEPATDKESELPAEPVPFATPTATGQRSIARVLGLRIRRIVIDAGHGGHDSGTIGPGGVEEKDVALDVALRLGKILHQRLGADVVYTRRTDKFVALEERTAIANRAHADLFLSIHANSSADPDVRGVETFFLNFTGSSDALNVAARENATSIRSVHELSTLVRQIALSNKINESRELAMDVQQSLYSGLAGGNAGLKNRGVKQAPFAVLIGAKMPSVLTEISFLTNPNAARELSRPAYRERLAEALYQGVARYVDGMSGVRVAKTSQSEAFPAPAE